MTYDAKLRVGETALVKLERMALGDSTARPDVGCTKAIFALGWGTSLNCRSALGDLLKSSRNLQLLTWQLSISRVDLSAESETLYLPKSYLEVRKNIQLS